MPVSRQFLGWDRPLLELAGESLMERAGVGPLLDLSDLLVIVPTRNAGRRLREMLAHLANQRGCALLSPQVVPPEYLLSLISEPGEGLTASPDQSLLAWIRVLKTADLNKYRALFPVDPVEQDFNWALGMARSLVDLRSTLGEAGLELVDVPDILGAELEEEDRWLELARLEQNFASLLKRQGLSDLQSVRKSRAGEPDPLEGVREVRVIGTPDPVPVTLRVLEVMATHYPVTVQIHAPEDLADGFDGWGRPETGYWSRRLIDLREGSEEIHVQPHCQMQADAVADRVIAYENPVARVTIGALDEEVTPALERRLNGAGIGTFNPQGVPLASRGIVHFFRCLRDLLKDRSVRAFLELLRCPEYAAWLKSELFFWDARWVLYRFDKLYQKHLPRDLEALRYFMKEYPEEVAVEHATTLEETEKLLRMLEKGPLQKVLPELLFEIFSARKRRANTDDEDVFRIAVEAIAPLLESLNGTLGKPLKLSAAEQMGLLVNVLEAQIIYEERTSGAVEICGWLELPWDDAPHLFLTGFNDGLVPDHIQGDPWLPENLRVKLAQHGHEVKTNQRRYARDAYLLSSMIAWRRECGGRMDIHFGKRSQKGDPLRPSRLLFRCRDEELPARAARLFGEVETREVNLAWTPGFQLRPKGLLPGLREPMETISVSAFRLYLESPLHFYLSKVEHMEGLDPDKLEMGAADFGNFCHEVLKKFGQDVKVRNSSDHVEIEDYLVSAAENLLTKIYGSTPALPVRVQFQSIMERLRTVAKVQAETRQEGWLIERVELPLDQEDWQICGVTIRGTVDRVDRHETSGAIRVLDYKTGDKAGDGPERSHIAGVTAGTNRDWLPDYALFEIEGRTFRWKDLQLPLYRIGLPESYGHEVTCGYFNLPKKAGEVGVQMWKDMNPDLDRATMDCAEGIIRDIQRGQFWPMRSRGRQDPYHTLHLSDPERTLDVVTLQGAHTLATAEVVEEQPDGPEPVPPPRPPEQEPPANRQGELFG